MRSLVVVALLRHDGMFLQLLMCMLNGGHGLVLRRCAHTWDLRVRVQVYYVAVATAPDKNPPGVEGRSGTDNGCGEGDHDCHRWYHSVIFTWLNAFGVS